MPVVLAVHGNHPAEQPSDAGYAYLAEKLCRRGYVFVSVDEAFLNEMVSDPLSGHMESLQGENAARAWLLLMHLAQLETWDATPGHPLHEALDLDRVTLIGHSRGGEAALVAAAFNRLDASPDDPGVRFDFHFGIRAVAALSPVDGQYEPGGRPASVEDISYLVIHGGMDSDVGEFAGSRAFHRVRLTGAVPGALKAAVFLDGANHAQFHSQWGRRDLGGLAGRLLASESVLPGEEQRATAAELVLDFVEAAIRGAGPRKRMFREERLAVTALPGVTMWTRYEQAGFTRIAAFDEDDARETGTLAGAVVVGRGFVEWREGDLPEVYTPMGTRAAWLTWGAPGATGAAGQAGTGAAELEIAIPSGVQALPRGAVSLELAVAPGGDLPPGTPLELSIEARDAEGRGGVVALSRVARVTRAPARSAWKSPLSRGRREDVVFQHVEVPLALFDRTWRETGARLTRLTLRFDGTPAAAVLLDDVGLIAPAVEEKRP